MRIEGKTLALRLVELSDAEFILGLRLDRRLNAYISPTNPSLDAQIEWLRQYKQREREGRECYFIIEAGTGGALGSLRLYDFQQDSFCWGSWIIKPGSPIRAAFESALLGYRCGFETLGFASSRFQVNKRNEGVVAWHKQFGAKIVSEDEINVNFTFAKADYLAACAKYKKLWQE